MRPLVLPWRGPDMPHAILDINRGCNIRCRACYNGRPAVMRSLEAVERDLDAMQVSRRLHTVTIGGGEPTLHPQLTDIVAAIRRRGLRVALMTNGLLLDEARLANLRDAGLDLVLLHIDAGQTRPDLPSNSALAVQQLRLAKARMVAGQQLAAGLIVTAYRTDPEDVLAAVRLVLSCPDLRFLVMTGHVDFESFGDVHGTLEAGFRGRPGAAESQMKAEHFRELIRRHFRAIPFARLLSQGPLSYDAWLSYRAVASRDAAVFLSSSLLERVALRALRIGLGRHVFFHVETPRAARLQVVWNALLGGSVRSLRLLGRGPLAMKYIVCQQGPTPDADGRLSVCRDCPDAVWRDDRWWPVCLADRTAPAPLFR